MNSGPRIYSDANPIIELARYQRGTHDPNREHDLWIMRQAMSAAQNEEIDLFTSSISVAECVAAGDDWGPEVQEFFVGALSSGRMFKLIQSDIFVAERARDLRWKDNVRLSGMDAIHVASAILWGCGEFFTWDRGINTDKLAAKRAILEQNGINVVAPSGTKLLPSYYLSEPIRLF